MKAHDILGVTIMADPAKIESAYSGKMNALLENGFDKTQPALYSRKAEELRKAREECLAYINAPFARKTQIEMTDCMNRMQSPNVMNSCCCGSGCETFLEGVCCVVIGAVGLAVLVGVGGLIYKIYNKIYKVWEHSTAKRLEKRDNEEYNDLERIRKKIIEKKAERTKKGEERKRLQERLDSIQDSANILNSFIESNGVSGDFMDSEVCRELKDKINLLSGEMKDLEDIIEYDKAQTNTIEQHHQEYLDFTGNGKR